jgi:hypothetical protein
MYYYSVSVDGGYIVANSYGVVLNFNHIWDVCFVSLPLYTEIYSAVIFHCTELLYVILNGK